MVLSKRLSREFWSSSPEFLLVHNMGGLCHLSNGVKLIRRFRKGKGGLVEYVLGQRKVRWAKRRAEKVEVTDRVNKLMSLAALHAQGLSSSSLPFCLVPAGNRLVFAEAIERLYSDLGDDYLGWLRREKSLVICWITGYKPGGQDSRPDRGLVPFGRMLVGEECDLLSVV